MDPEFSVSLFLLKSPQKMNVIVVNREVAVVNFLLIINSIVMKTNIQTSKDPGCCVPGSECCNGLSDSGCC